MSIKKEREENGRKCDEETSKKRCMPVSTMICSKSSGQAGLQVANKSDDDEDGITIEVRSSSGNVMINISKETAKTLSEELSEMIESTPR